MRVAFTSLSSANDIRGWSGTPYFTYRALAAQPIELEDISGLAAVQTLDSRLKQSVFARLNRFTCYKKRYIPFMDPSFLTQFANQVHQRLAELRNIDLLFSVEPYPVGYLDCKLPVVMYGDTTFSGLLDFYPSYSNLSFLTINHGRTFDTLTFNRCNRLIYSSEWAAESAMRNYNVDPKKIRIVPFGANLECVPQAEDVKLLIASRSKQVCKLVFIGADWIRKGGDMAIQVVRELTKLGVKSELTVIGSEPANREGIPSNVIFHGFVSKATQEGRDLIKRSLAESHFLIVPTLAECAGVVFCEASAFGVPSLVTDVGGTSSIVRNSVNGMRFDRSASASHYAHYIANLFFNYLQYIELAESSFDEYVQRLNWSVVGSSLYKIISGLV